jgi:catechol 2,3-dioxygenase-like lactoylglutathione lyase family enzyme
MLRHDDFARAQARLRERGVEFRFEDHGNARSVYFPDPDGNVVELTTYEP